jgi:isoleucyl-tRNA synthetase
MFAPLPDKFSFPESEEQILRFWEENQIFEKSLERRAAGEPFVFYEGPPTANGLPHPGHCLTRAMKDLFPRYQTMCGRFVERKAGWDTHGLPVEVEVCKELGIHTKEEIESYGVEKFVRLCIDSVFRYVKEWETLTKRLGFWVNLDEAYVTFHQSYVESVWWGLKTLFERGLLYQGHKVVWWWAQGGTALSAGEVGEGYRTVQDPSVYVRFPLVQHGLESFNRVLAGESRLPLDAEIDLDADQALDYIASYYYLEDRLSDPEPPSAEAIETRPRESLAHIIAVVNTFIDERPREAEEAARHKSLLVWTTTPWTLVSNHFAAVGPDIDYTLVLDQTTDEYLYIATGLVESTLKKIKHDYEVVATCKGIDLVGLRYIPPFPDVYHKDLGDKTAPLKDGGEEYLGWRVTLADFVTLESGTGLVHEAPAYGEVDFELLQNERQRFKDELNSIPLVNAVGPDGKYTDEAPEAYRGRWVKDCDKDIIRELKERGILLHQETIEHEYPFCPRAEEDALIQYARKSWFVRTSQFKDEFLANNANVYWLPEHIREGRFGDFLRNNVDWALSRERFWGTPLPVWKCDQTGQMEAIGSLDELKTKPGANDTTDEFPDGMWATKKKEDPSLPDHLMVHKPYIDAWTYDSPFVDGGAGVSPARMRRVPEVIDCWWDAGSMPFAQWGFPHAEGSVEKFAQRFPANFISEALDQTRGWFYGLLSISTLLFGKEQGAALAAEASKALAPQRDYPHPYKACIVLGLMMGEDGLKMSKRKKNYREPTYVFDSYGADAMRWFLFSGQTPWTSVRFQEQNIRDAQREFLVRLYNVLSFFNIYARIDGFIADPQHGSPWRPTAERNELDRWIVSELFRTTKFVREKLDNFENFPAAQRLNEFVDALSNWYVRRSRDRFWKPLEGTEARRHEGTEATESGSGLTSGALPTSPPPHLPTPPADQDKWDAYHTLYGVLLNLSQLIAPFTPFFAETMYQNLTKPATDAATSPPPHLPTSPLSVHLCDYPTVDEALINEDLAQEMDLVRDIVSLGRAARTAAKLKVRQPLALVEIILVRAEHTDWLQSHAVLIAEELNIKQVEFTTEADHYVSYQIKPNFKSIGPKFGKQGKQVGAALGKLDPATARQQLSDTGQLEVELDGSVATLTSDDVDIRLEAKPGWSAAQGRAGVVVVKTELTDELRAEGLVRELIHHVQGIRKDLNLAYQARIAVTLEAPDEFRLVTEQFANTIKSECLVDRLEFNTPTAGEIRDVKVEKHPVKLGVEALG